VPHNYGFPGFVPKIYRRCTHPCPQEGANLRFKDREVVRRSGSPWLKSGRRHGLEAYNRILIICLLLTTCALECYNAASAYDPATQGEPAKPNGFRGLHSQAHQSFRQDYGKCLDQGRKLMLQESIRMVLLVKSSP